MCLFYVFITDHSHKYYKLLLIKAAYKSVITQIDIFICLALTTKCKFAAMQSSERKKKAQSDGAFAVSVKSVIIAALSFYSL